MARRLSFMLYVKTMQLTTRKNLCMCLCALLIIPLLLSGCASIGNIGVLQEFSKIHKEARTFDSSFEKINSDLENILKEKVTSFSMISTVYSKTSEQKDSVTYEGKKGSASGEKLEIKVSRIGDNKTAIEVSAKPINPLLSSNPYQAVKDIVDALRVKVEESRPEAPTTAVVSAQPVTPSLPRVKTVIDDVPNFKAAPRENDLALIIGIENYQTVPRSDYSKVDAELVKDYLKAMGFQERNIELITDERATFSSIKKSVERWLPNRAKKNSKVFIYYSGHGSPEPSSGDAYMMPYDGDPNYLSDTAYPLKRLYANLGKLDVEDVVVMLDACFSGAGGRSVLAKGARPLVMTTETTLLPPNIAVLSATQGTQISSSSPEKGHGIFTYYFLKAIKEGKKNLSEIYDYIKPLVEDEAKQLNVQQSPDINPVPEKLKGRFSLRN